MADRRDQRLDEILVGREATVPTRSGQSSGCMNGASVVRTAPARFYGAVELPCVLVAASSIAFMIGPAIPAPVSTKF